MAAADAGADDADADDAGAMHLFGVEHHSMKIEMIDRAGAHKTLHLSPVMLAYWFNYFSTRTRDPSAWISIGVLEVADVAVAEQLFRYCYNPYILKEWIRGGLEWSWIVSAVETCDMLQAENGMVEDVFDLVRAKIDKATGANMYECLLRMMNIFLGIPVGANERYRSLMNKGFERIDGMADDLDSALTLVPEEMYLAYSWHVFGNGRVHGSRADDAMTLIARDLAATKDDDHAQIHIAMIAQQGEIVRLYSIDGVEEVQDILEKIDTTSASVTILHARDALMLYLKKVTFGKRKRDE